MNLRFYNLTKQRNLLMHSMLIYFPYIEVHTVLLSTFTITDMFNDRMFTLPLCSV